MTKKLRCTGISFKFCDNKVIHEFSAGEIYEVVSHIDEGNLFARIYIASQFVYALKMDDGTFLASFPYGSKIKFTEVK